MNTDAITFHGLLGYVTPHWRTLLLALLLMLGESAAALVNPWLAGRFSEIALGPAAGIAPALLPLLGAWALLLALQSALAFANRYLLGSTGETMLAGLRGRLYDHLQSLPLGYFHSRRRGEILSLLGNDAAQISHFVTGTLVGLLPLLLTFAGAFWMLMRISPAIALLAAILVPSFVILVRLVGRRLRPLSSAWVQSHAAMFATLEENIGMLPAIKSFTREAHESHRFRERNTHLMWAAKRRLLMQSILAPATQLLAGLGLLLLLYIASRQVAQGTLSPSEMVSVLLYGMLITRPVNGLAGVYGSLQTARGAAERLLEAFAVQPEPDDRRARSLGAVAGQVRFQAVHFAYPGRGPVLKGLDLEIGAGETLAITGPNGCGKSTIVHLLMRFADPDRGSVLLDGIDLRRVRITDLRGRIGLVAQHVLLLNASVRDNIAYGRPDASQASIEAAAEGAMAHEFIRALPNGYDTLIGDQGIRLSGGQRQRIALARALLKDPPLLIFDEATAMFDPEGETDFIESCGALLAERTVILITHRPASLALADRILRIEDGRIRGSSTPHRLPAVAPAR